MIQKSIFTSLFCMIITFSMAQSWGDDSKNKGIIFTSVETAPKFPGGTPAFYQCIAENLKFPENKFSVSSGKFVILRVIVDTSGSPVFAEIEKGINEEYNKAALSILEKMPKWKPALQNGKPVPVWIRIPLVFID